MVLLPSTVLPLGSRVAFTGDFVSGLVRSVLSCVWSLVVGFHGHGKVGAELGAMI